jgi:demethylmenaquinone methyltransferase/2-methoxy-6-polyprenyl-1,4-benzoquinol methylase
METSVPDKTPYKQGYKFYSRNILLPYWQIVFPDNAPTAII